jgi:hypothetical protein
MFAAKERGRNRIECFSAALDERTSGRVAKAGQHGEQASGCRRDARGSCQPSADRARMHVQQFLTAGGDRGFLQ